MQSKLKLAVATTALVAVALLATPPDPGSSADVVETAGVPRINVRVLTAEGVFRALRPVPVIGSKLAGLFHEQEAAWQLARQVEKATASLHPHEGAQVVAEVCTMMDFYEAGAEWDRLSTFQQSSFLLSQAPGRVGHIAGGVRSFSDVVDAFQAGKDNRHWVLAKEATCQAAEHRAH